MYILVLIFLASIIPPILAIPASRPELQNERRADLSIPTLPYGTRSASKYDANADIYTFKSIRFAAPPVGDLR
jgi:hypothetical protein